MDLSYPYEVKNKKERAYIRKRKRKAFLSSLCFYLCRIFPVKKNLVSVCTFEGRGGFGCNPKYIVQELHERNPEYQFVWFVNDMEQAFPGYIRKVPNTLWSRAYWLGRSKIWIDNYRKPLGTKKRKGQYYINTWHANIGFKAIGLWREQAFSYMAYLVSRNDSKMIDAISVDSKFCEEMFQKGLLYDGNYIKTGQARCDILYGNREMYKKQFCDKYQLEKGAKVVMFAPTFREGAKNGVRSVYSEEWTIDFSSLIRSLEQKFGGSWYICMRVHPQLADKFGNYTNQTLKERIINESQAADMYEILAAMDAYITDYSSAAFDACCSEMPVFIYADDIEEYSNDRGLLWNLSVHNIKQVENNKMITPDIDAKLPFPIARNNEELRECIEKFDMQSYKNKVRKMMQAVDMVFDGNASRKIVDEIVKS